MHKSKDFQNKIYLGVYTCAYALLSLILKVNDFFWINHANCESSYILILIMHNIIFDIVVSLWNLYVEFYKCELHWLIRKCVGLPMWHMRILWWNMTFCFQKMKIRTLCKFFWMIQLSVSTLIMIWKLPMHSEIYKLGTEASPCMRMSSVWILNFGSCNSVLWRERQHNNRSWVNSS
jgi:hypothetical protein